MIRNIKLRQLEIFDAVVRNGNFTRAADELFLSQPAVSTQMKQLESAVGHELINRKANQFSITDAGQRVYELAQQVSDELRRFEEDLVRLKAGDSGSIKVTVASTVNYFAARILAQFHASHPGIEITLDVTNRNDLMSQLENRSTDIALMGTPPRDIPVDSAEFMINPLVVIASASHPLANSEAEHRVEDLSDCTFISREPGSGTRLATERRFGELGYSPARTVVMRGNEAIKQSVEAGVGIAVVSRHTIAFELEHRRLSVLDVEGFPILRKWFCVHRSDRPLSAACALFKEYVVKHSFDTATEFLGEQYAIYGRLEG